jgi:drug/metabolite transporter (DMT)-like permease
MAHNEHNRQKKGGGFFLIIFGALLLFLAPNLHTDNPELGIVCLIFGIIVGAGGFYVRFIKMAKRI